MNIIFFSVVVFRFRTLYQYSMCTSTYLYSVLGNHGVDTMSLVACWWGVMVNSITAGLSSILEDLVWVDVDVEMIWCWVQASVGKFFWTQSVKILVILNPAGYMLISFSFSLFIWGVFYINGWLFSRSLELQLVSWSQTFHMQLTAGSSRT